MDMHVWHRKEWPQFESIFKRFSSRLRKTDYPKGRKIGSDANGGGVALNSGNTNGMSGGIALNGGQDHQGCNVAIGAQCFNVPGR
jgi:hypothetical protein